MVNAVVRSQPNHGETGSIRIGDRLENVQTRAGFRQIADCRFAHGECQLVLFVHLHRARSALGGTPTPPLCCWQRPETAGSCRHLQSTRSHESTMMTGTCVTKQTRGSNQQERQGQRPRKAVTKGPCALLRCYLSPITHRLSDTVPSHSLRGAGLRFRQVRPRRDVQGRQHPPAQGI